MGRFFKGVERKLAYLVIIEKVKYPTEWTLTPEEIVDYYFMQDTPNTYIEVKIFPSEYDADQAMMLALAEGAIEVRKAKELMTASGIDKTKLA